MATSIEVSWKVYCQLEELFHPTYTLPKLNSSPLKSNLPNRKGSSSNHQIFRGELAVKLGGC